jgi:hypothetical protein
VRYKPFFGPSVIADGMSFTLSFTYWFLLLFGTIRSLVFTICTCFHGLDSIPPMISLTVLPLPFLYD